MIWMFRERVRRLIFIRTSVTKVIWSVFLSIAVTRLARIFYCLWKLIILSFVWWLVDSETMEDWDQENLEKVVESKKKEYNQNKPTEIVYTLSLWHCLDLMMLLVVHHLPQSYIYTVICVNRILLMSVFLTFHYQNLLKKKQVVTLVLCWWFIFLFWEETVGLLLCLLLNQQNLILVFADLDHVGLPSSCYLWSQQATMSFLHIKSRSIWMFNFDLLLQNVCPNS